MRIEANGLKVSKHVVDAWEAAADKYEKGLVTSESTLQLHLAISLLSTMPDCEVHCQVEITGQSRGKLYPDLLVVHGSSVLAVLELKFSPEDLPKWSELKRDLEKLSCYAAFDKPKYPRLVPRLGKYGGDGVLFSNETLYGLGLVAPARARARSEELVREASNVSPLLLFIPSAP